MFRLDFAPSRKDRVLAAMAPCRKTWSQAQRCRIRPIQPRATRALPRRSRPTFR